MRESFLSHCQKNKGWVGTKGVEDKGFGGELANTIMHTT